MTTTELEYLKYSHRDRYEIIQLLSKLLKKDKSEFESLNNLELNKILVILRQHRSELTNVNDDAFMEITDRKNLFKSSYENEKFRQHINSLPHIGLYGKSTNNILLVFFAGKNEHFSPIFKINGFGGHFIIFRDILNEWYTYMVDIIKSFIDAFLVSNNNPKIIFMGQSMGAYAALLLSSYYERSITIAFNPQTFKNTNVCMHSKVKYCEIPTYLSIQNTAELNKNIKNSKYIIVGPTEGDYNSIFPWYDLLSVGCYINDPYTKIMIVPVHQHTVIQYISFTKLHEILINNYDLLYGDVDKGAKKILEDIVFI